jgi:hypothetical protein
MLWKYWAAQRCYLKSGVGFLLTADQLVMLLTANQLITVLTAQRD